MITNNKDALDEVFQPAEKLVNAEQQEASQTEGKVKPHVLRRNIEDYLERKALERKLRDVFDDDFPLD